MTTETRTFSINLHCQNCGTEWYEEVPFKTEVSVSSSGVYLHPCDCVRWKGLQCSGRYIVCEVCGVENKVRGGIGS